MLYFLQPSHDSIANDGGWASIAQLCFQNMHSFKYSITGQIQITHTGNLSQPNLRQRLITSPSEIVSVKGDYILHVASCLYVSGYITPP